MVKSIPSNWINLLKSDENSTKTISMKNNILSCGGMILQIDKLSSNSIYTVLCDNQTVQCKSQLKFSKLTHEFEWHDVCNLISLVTIDTYTKYFQFKVIHNYLSVNSKLKLWQVADSNRCSYCFIESETVEHLCVECSLAVTFYNTLKHWCLKYKLLLPELNIINIKYRILPCSVNNALLNLIIILYKQIIFNGRNNPKTISIELFKFKLREFRQSII